MCAAKWRPPCLYTRSKSACRSRCALRGNTMRLPVPGRWLLPCGRALTAHHPNSGCRLPPTPEKERTLLTETRFHRDPLAALGAPARDYGATALGLHSSTKSVRLRAMTPVRLKCALGHETSLLLVLVRGV